MNVDSIREFVEENGIIFVSYGGVITQSLISAMTEALEKEAEETQMNMGISSNLFTIFIELSQNMMNYSKSIDAEDEDSIVPDGLIVVSKNSDCTIYSIDSQNIVSKSDKDIIEPRLQEIQDSSKDEIKKRYKELRRSGRHSHGKGGGIGFYEIAKRCDGISFEFKPINENKYYFHIKITINNKNK